MLSNTAAAKTAAYYILCALLANNNQISCVNSFQYFTYNFKCNYYIIEMKTNEIDLSTY